MIDIEKIDDIEEYNEKMYKNIVRKLGKNSEECQYFIEFREIFYKQNDELSSLEDTLEKIEKSAHDNIEQYIKVYDYCNNVLKIIKEWKLQR